MEDYKITNSYAQPVIQFSTGQNYSMQLSVGIMGCCGLASLASFGYQTLSTFEQKAKWLEFLYAHNRTARRFIYVLTTSQLNAKYQPLTEHQTLLDIGAVQMGEKFSNLAHGPNDLYLFMVDITGAIGKYLDPNGVALKTGPSLKKEVVAPKAKKIDDSQPPIPAPNMAAYYVPPVPKF